MCIHAIICMHVHACTCIYSLLDYCEGQDSQHKTEERNGHTDITNNFKSTDNFFGCLQQMNCKSHDYCLLMYIYMHVYRIYLIKRPGV